MNAKILLLLLAICLLASHAVVPSQNHAGEPLALLAGPPQPIQHLTLDVLDAIAQNENPSIARTASLLEAARGNWVQVGLAPNPNAGYEGQQLGSGGRAEQQGVWVEQELVRGGKLRVNREIAAREISRANQELTAQRQRVSTDVRILFFQALTETSSNNRPVAVLQACEDREDLLSPDESRSSFPRQKHIASTGKSR